MSEEEKPEASPPKKRTTIGGGATIGATLADVRSPDQWARMLGEYHAPKYPWQEPHYSARHAAAAALHGWNEHTHHSGAPMFLSQADYLAALEAAMPKIGNAKAHKPALSKHCGHSGGHAPTT
jgi:hypothetical protein